MNWIADNLGTILVGAVLLAIVISICVHLIKKKKKTGSTCGCGCSECSISSICHKN
ncbi:hypothetical protein Cst_c17500 [Thermoclostridium stercorarium subsp. stercorarium DSM 8532]|jgi:hypothetical protein|uniref:FeoB-associated Cys-rich membrane protein n=1 Tax=Thermoclostridium stercorarium (strain ATCC 35414 / DSM 8532 / NCIMB 11754) TaxID=1121335 RepID=L7VKS7_THES1|nr:FeoB-associated Cys-rich membrane protein [Thermoclostridium stercorarium]AGC68730.1 hypothetical protein Cst_c17500 [Thermoclostridium stercorarium subsp. stercorarium DSM 8532]AGI39738.1 hypothetical protein Clst_1684 [Thermoclostridium stercorarium subsp. stercorarium DSM 8532]UZQ84707.1 FeoB-associated Cys-rich membrane protein [Thermoclostridium stercorarium]